MSCRMKSSVVSRLLAVSFPHLPLGPSPSRALIHPIRLPILFTTHRPEEKTKGLAVVIDARKQPPHPGLVRALQATQVSGSGQPQPTKS